MIIYVNEKKFLQQIFELWKFYPWGEIEFINFYIIWFYTQTELSLIPSESRQKQIKLFYKRYKQYKSYIFLKKLVDM